MRTLPVWWACRPASVNSLISTVFSRVELKELIHTASCWRLLSMIVCLLSGLGCARVPLNPSSTQPPLCECHTNTAAIFCISTKSCLWKARPPWLHPLFSVSLRHRGGSWLADREQCCRKKRPTADREAPRDNPVSKSDQNRRVQKPETRGKESLADGRKRNF